MHHERSYLESANPLLPLLAVAFLIGSTAALLGSYWDDAWHTNRGRDDFLIGPHIALYTGVLASGGAMALWFGFRMLNGGLESLRSERSLALAALGLAATLGAAPIDNAWHLAFGRDAVLWSPPHLLGIIGLIGLAVAMLSVLSPLRARWADTVRTLTSGMVVGGATFIVAEYETDVPQFPELLYLPVLAVVSALAFELVRMTIGGRWPATRAAAAHLFLMLVVWAYLTWAIGWEPPLIPLLLGPALVLDLTTDAAWRASTMAAAFVASLYLLYLPYVAAILQLQFDVPEIAAGLLISFAAVFVLLRILEHERERTPRPPRASGAVRRSRVRVVLAAVFTVALVAASSGRAHDPGQGEVAGDVEIAARSQGTRAVLELEILEPHLCRDAGPRALVARRAGRTLRAPLAQRGCDLRGSIELPEDGRWFLYAELGLGDENLEAWLPIEIGRREARMVSATRSLYAVGENTAGGLQIGATLMLYAACLALVAMIVRFAAGAVPRGA